MHKVADRVEVLAGRQDLNLDRHPMRPYSELACDFLNDLSAKLMSEREAKQFPDIITFAFWCRRANLAKLKEQFVEPQLRLGLGYVFHIAPSNIPINFAFSFAFSLLAGNANLVRVPSKAFGQTVIVCQALKELFEEPKYQAIADRTALIRYPQDNAVTAVLSEDCNARIIWGGDETIRNIRQLPIPTRSVEIAFADRYSFCVMESAELLRADERQMQRLANGFYNDTFLMDQNACSAPHLIVWLGAGEQVVQAKEKFWQALYDVTTTKYDLQPVFAVDKYTDLCRHAIDVEGTKTFSHHENYIYRVSLKSLPERTDKLRGKAGYFFEYETENFHTVAPIVTNKYQTLTYYGVDKGKLADFVVANSLSGIDRIVPIGNALEISIIWDGYDLVRSLSRIVDVQ